MATKRLSKMSRMIDAIDICSVGKKRAKRRYGRMTLQKAWNAASGNDIQYLLEALKIRPPKGYKCTCGSRSCFYKIGRMGNEGVRKLFGHKPPEKVRAAYAKA